MITANVTCLLPHRARAVRLSQACLDYSNEHPVRSVWTKTADQIIAKAMRA